jgi:hypothetical protein
MIKRRKDYSCCLHVSALYSKEGLETSKRISIKVMDFKICCINKNTGNSSTRTENVKTNENKECFCMYTG